MVVLTFWGIAHKGWAKTKIEAGVSIGAIRWDAWYDPASQVGAAVEKTLSPAEFHHRMPFFGKEISVDKVAINGNDPTLFDHELTSASRMGLNYWAYCWYPPNSTLRNAWNLHQRSSSRNLMNWCMLWQTSWMNDPSEFGEDLSPLLRLIQQRNYQKVFDDRPLIYVYIDQIGIKPGSESPILLNARNVLSRLRAQCESSGLPRPYITVLRNPPFEAGLFRSEILADAISAYAEYPPAGEDVPFSALDLKVRASWLEMTRVAGAVIPLVMTGWDRRPRQQSHVFWEPIPKNDTKQINYVHEATSFEVSSAITAACSFVNEHPTECLAKAILIYSWNECDEGGGALIPTFNDTQIVSEISRCD